MNSRELKHIIKEEIKQFLSEKVIKPNTRFIPIQLNKFKNELLSCKTNKECDDVLNKALNDYWIIVNHSKTKDEACVNQKWSLDTANTIPNSKSEDGSIVEMTVGIGFVKKMQGIKNNSQWDNFVDSFRFIISHEYVHKVQVPKMPDAAIESTWDAKKVDDNIKYLSIPQEIMAFALQSVKELQSNGYTRKDIMNALRNPSTVPDEDSEIFYTYKYFFKPTDPQMKRFLKNMYEYIT